MLLSGDCEWVKQHKRNIEYRPTLYDTEKITSYNITKSFFIGDKMTKEQKLARKAELSAFGLDIHSDGLHFIESSEFGSCCAFNLGFYIQHQAIHIQNRLQDIDQIETQESSEEKQEPKK